MLTFRAIPFSLFATLLAADDNDEMPMGQRIALWFLFAGYFLYAWRLGPIRESLGVNPNAGSPFIDNTQRVVATIALFFITFLVIVGKKVCDPRDVLTFNLVSFPLNTQRPFHE